MALQRTPVITNLDCGGCPQKIVDRQYLKCCICNKFYDLLCANVSGARFAYFTEDHRKTWKCPECMSKKSRKDNSNNFIGTERIFFKNSKNANVTIRKPRKLLQVSIDNLSTETIDESSASSMDQLTSECPNGKIQNEVTDLTMQLIKAKEEINHLCWANSQLRNTIAVLRDANNSSLKIMEWDLSINSTPISRSSPRSCLVSPARTKSTMKSGCPAQKAVLINALSPEATVTKPGPDTTAAPSGKAAALWHATSVPSTPLSTTAQSKPAEDATPAGQTAAPSVLIGAADVKHGQTATDVAKSSQIVVDVQHNLSVAALLSGPTSTTGPKCDPALIAPHCCPAAVIEKSSRAVATKPCVNVNKTAQNGPSEAAILSSPASGAEKSNPATVGASSGPDGAIVTRSAFTDLTSPSTLIVSTAHVLTEPVESAQTVVPSVFSSNCKPIPRNCHKIIIIGDQNCKGLASSLIKLRSGSHNAKHYEVQNFTYPDAPSHHVIKKFEASHYSLSEDDWVVLSVGSNDKSLSDIRSEITAFLQIFTKVNLIITGIVNNPYLNENSVNKNLRSLTYSFTNCRFIHMPSHHSWYNISSQKNNYHLCKLLNKIIDTEDYKTCYLGRNITKMSKLCNTKQTTVIKYNETKTKSEIKPKRGTIPYYFNKINKEKTQNVYVTNSKGTTDISSHTEKYALKTHPLEKAQFFL